MNIVEITDSKAITEAKRLWKQDKKVMTYSDEISKEEKDVFDGDEELIRLVKLRKNTELAIINRVDCLLKEYREDQAALERNQHNEQAGV